MITITKSDLLLINNLRSRTYKGYKLTSNSTNAEQLQLTSIKKKLRNITDFFATKYQSTYGPFEKSISSGNPITQHNTFNNIWAGIFKGASNKQYAGQISFVLNQHEPCLNVGFYFGRASARSVSPEERTKLETQLRNLGLSLSSTIEHDEMFRNRFESLFDFGFRSFSDGQEVPQKEWTNKIGTNPKNSQIIVKIYPNDFDVIENSTIDFFVSQVMFLMGAMRDTTISTDNLIIKPLTPEQRAKQAERLAQIGQNGELLVMQHEKDRLANLGIDSMDFPRHVALESMHFGYDILSLDKNQNKILIEVKTTSRSIDDPNSKSFFLSTNEFKTFEANRERYQIYRVYSIDSKPCIEILNLNDLEKQPDGYVVRY